ncbi:hypothetical protein MCOR27_010154 [Pyricularia oryzae]|nr:hypothetical protein MCOR02_007526 [Pyricularia oryzae]KAI6268427.1 hypothetical protein MCOR27_010154 [Pyricularia oryzae]KAI6291846.1 hypothetical protein MCOR34_010100 [Pyricularia oryzae]KAI6395344.1 hypothetical protein MCOR23_007103 [Pyricularia oryzae]KAI6432344.1 hypothetical protein MCOR21_003466 [Pyricularia oryzae]
MAGPESINPRPVPEAMQASSESQDEDYSIFSNKMRLYLTYLLGLVMVLSTISATIYFPLIPMLSREFASSIQDINLTVTVYAVCQAVAPALFAPLADSHGRRPVLLFLVALYACASLGLALNKGNYATLAVLRALQSIGASPTITIAYGVVADVAVVAERGSMLGPALGTCNGISALGPVIGGAMALGTSGSKWVFLALLIYSVLCFLLVGISLPETARSVAGNGSKPVSGVWKPWKSYVASLRCCTGEKSGHDGSGNQDCSAPRTAQGRNLELGGKRRLLRGPLDAILIILHADSALVLWVIASSYTVYYIFQVAVPVVFSDIYGYNSLEIGLSMLPGLAGMTIGGMIAGKLVDRNFAVTARAHNAVIERNRLTSLDDFPIEAARYRHILPVIALQAALVAGYGWAVQYGAHAAAAMVLQFAACCCSTMLSHTASALLVDMFPEQSSTAYASGQMMRCGLSAAAAAIIDPASRLLGRGWFFTVVSLFIGTTGAGCVILSRAKGMQWRQRRTGYA